MDRNNNLGKIQFKIIDGGFSKLKKTIGKLKIVIKTRLVNILIRVCLIKVWKCLKLSAYVVIIYLNNFTFSRIIQL